jgi:hypothetical protein
LRQFGDPNLPIEIKVRELALLIISAKVRVLPDYAWELLEPKIRAALLDAFSFERRELGQDVLLSEVISVIQGIPGVAYVDVDILDSVSETIQLEKLEDLDTTLTSSVQPRERVEVKPTWIDPYVADPQERIRPAQLAILSPEIPDTLLLTELSS